MDVRKTIAELTSQLSEINYESEDDNILLKDSKNTVYQNDNDNEFEAVEPSKLRKSTASLNLSQDIYGGKKTSRKETYSASDDSDSDIYKATIGEGDSDEEEENDASGEGDNSGEENSSEVEDLEDSDEEQERLSNLKSNRPDNKSVDIYSSASKNFTNDIKKGTAIRNQLRIWESLLECRIKLQKGLVACNELPTKENLLKAKIHMDPENQQTLNKCKKNLLLLLDKMVELQGLMMKQCSELKQTKQVDPDEDIPSDESGIDKSGSEDEGEETQPAKKKRKLNDYSKLITDNHAKFIPIRNAAIQKWNDKTKVSTGKMANSNFSAFDQSTLEQIEQIMADKSRLLNRTRINRSGQQSSNEESLQEITLDPEIFDDTDFYHKLLRDYIERKSFDAANSSHSERQLIELQKLRSKMKKNVDTRSTKGRKIRYVVLPKLVNFMAPEPCNTWSEEAETELYNSLFGKIKV